MLPSPATVHMVRCPVCDATGKTGTTLGFGGMVCGLCHGTCFLRSEPNPCPCCNANVSDNGYACMLVCAEIMSSSIDAHGCVMSLEG